MKKFLSLALLLILALVVFAACRSTDEEETTTTQVTTTTAGEQNGNGDENITDDGVIVTGFSAHSQGVTDTTITVGNTAATSGGFATVGVPFNAGMQAYFDIVNAAGGINGRTIQFIHHDDGFDAPTGIAMTEQLIHDDRVFALVGHFGTPTVGATLPMIFETGIPAVYFATGIGQLFIPNAATVATGQRIFPVQPIFEPEGYVLVARAASEYSVTTLGLIFSNDDAGQDMARGARSQAAELGITLVEMQVNPADLASTIPAALAMRDADVDAIIVAMNQGPFPATINALVANGVDVPVFTSYVNADATMIEGFASDYLSANADFPVYSTAWLDIFDPNGAEGFHADYWEFFAGISAIDDTLIANSFAMAGWIAASTFVQGLYYMGDVDFVTWEGLTEALESNLINLPMGGAMDFSNGQRTGTTSMTLNRADVEELEWIPIRPFALLSDIIDTIN